MQSNRDIGTTAIGQARTNRSNQIGAAGICFYQECPACSRQLRIRVDLLGQKVACRNCCRIFTACDPAAKRNTQHEPTLLERADRLLLLLLDSHGVAPR